MGNENADSKTFADIDGKLVELEPLEGVDAATAVSLYGALWIGDDGALYRPVSAAAGEPRTGTTEAED